MEMEFLMLQKPNYKKSDMLTAENTVIETIDLEPIEINSLMLLMLY